MSQEINDDSLATLPPALAKQETPELTPKAFDMASWLNGVTPLRRTVTIYADGHADADITRLAEQEALAPEGEREKLAEQLRELYAARVAGAAHFIIEGRSSTWVEAFLEEQKKDTKDSLEVTLRQIAAQIISPRGVTSDQLRQLHEVRESEVNRLAEAVLKVNSEKLGIDPRFLPGASA